MKKFNQRKKNTPSFPFLSQSTPKKSKNKLTYSKKKTYPKTKKKKHKLHTYHSQKQITQTLEIYTEIQSTESRKLWADVFTNFWAGGRVGRRVRSTPETD